MVHKKICILICLVCLQFGYSQEIKFGKVTKEELEEKTYEYDQSASAVVLYKKQITYFDVSTGGTQLITEIHERIKIFNKEGFEHATQFIDLFKSRSSNEHVGRINASTFNLEGGKIVETELDKDQVFKTEVRYNYDQVKFTMPNIKEGSVIEFKYKITSPFVWNIDEFKLQYSIPIKLVEAEIRTPEGFNFKATTKGYVPVYGKQGNSYNGLKATKYILTNVPALKEESYVDNIDNYRTGILFELVSIQIPGVIYRDYATTWGDVAKTIGNTDDYENKLDKSKFFNDNLDSLLGTKTDQVDKMKAVFQYVKNNIKWNSMDGIYFYKGIKNALKEKKGNVADINLTLVAMLRYAGINANPLAISTKDNIIPYFPTVDRLNYVIAYAVINENKYFLDATDEFSDINVLPIKDYNWKGVYIDNINMKWNLVDIREPEKASKICILNGSLQENGSLAGKLSVRYAKHSAFNFRGQFKNVNSDDFISKRAKMLRDIEISNYQVDNTDTYDGFVTENFDFSYDTAADVVGNKIYLNPIAFLKQDENPFKAESREFPIDFGFPFNNK